MNIHAGIHIRRVAFEDTRIRIAPAIDDDRCEGLDLGDGSPAKIMNSINEARLRQEAGAASANIGPGILISGPLNFSFDINPPKFLPKSIKSRYDVIGFMM